jgi:hypothetical protein
MKQSGDLEVKTEIPRSSERLMFHQSNRSQSPSSIQRCKAVLIDALPAVNGPISLLFSRAVPKAFIFADHIDMALKNKGRQLPNRRYRHV